MSIMLDSFEPSFGYLPLPEKKTILLDNGTTDHPEFTSFVAEAELSGGRGTITQRTTPNKGYVFRYSSLSFPSAI